MVRIYTSIVPGSTPVSINILCSYIIVTSQWKHQYVQWFQAPWPVSSVATLLLNEFTLLSHSIEVYRSKSFDIQSSMFCTYFLSAFCSQYYFIRFCHYLPEYSTAFTGLWWMTSTPDYHNSANKYRKINFNVLHAFPTSWSFCNRLITKINKWNRLIKTNSKSSLELHTFVNISTALLQLAAAINVNGLFITQLK